MQTDSWLVNQSADAFVLELNTLGELFDAPDLDPFKPRVMDALGIAGIEHVQKSVQHTWPRKPSFERIVLKLPADQITPDAEAKAQTAIQRYCDAQLEKSQLLYGQAMRVSKRQSAIALILLVFVVLALAWIANTSFTGLLGFMMGIMAILIVVAFSLAMWDAVQSIFFTRGPFRQDDAILRVIRAMRVSVTAK